MKQPLPKCRAPNCARDSRYRTEGGSKPVGICSGLCHMHQNRALRGMPLDKEARKPKGLGARDRAILECIEAAQAFWNPEAESLLIGLISEHGRKVLEKADVGELQCS